MTAIRTTAVLEDARHLRLNEPLTDAVGTVLNVIVLASPLPTSKLQSGSGFQAALGSYYIEHPAEAPRSTDEWLAELREGETD